MADGITVQVKGDELGRELAEPLRRVPARVEKEVLVPTGREIVSRAARITRSTRIARSLRVERLGQGVVEVGVRAADVGFNPVFELDDTRPHTILPRRAQALRFTKDGQVIFARRVKHPGTEGSDALRRALRQSRGLMLARARRLLKTL